MNPLIYAISGIFISVAIKFVKDHEKLKVKPYHSANKRIISNCTIINRNLKACKNRSAIDRRLYNMTFARTSVDLDFHKLDSLYNTHLCTYYICQKWKTRLWIIIKILQFQ